MTGRPTSFDWLRRYQHVVLVLLLATLHFVSLAGPESVTGRWLFLVDAGLLLLWQPFVGGDQRLNPTQASVTLLSIFVVVWQLGWGWLALWHAFLAALVGGKVVMARGVRHRWFYLHAFAYLVGAMLVWVSPNIIPHEGLGDTVLPTGLHFTAAVLLAAMLIALPRTEDQRPAELHDFLASLLILLLLSVLLLGTVALMALRKIAYYEALVLTLLGAGALLFLLSWSWSPKPGFGGLGASLSRYLLRIGLDFDRWLRHQIDLAENELDPVRFLQRSLAAFSDLPWVAGGEWQVGADSGRFGERARHETAFDYRGVSVKLYTPYAWTASLVWQASLLLKLVVELHHAKAREVRLRQLEYVEAVHETGARLTHDIKNLLQSLEALCYAAEHAPAGDEARLAGLMRRQLPALGMRLRASLDKLRHPRDEPERSLTAAAWWEALKRRTTADGIVFAAAPADANALLPGALFDSVADNLLMNALYKRSSDHRIGIRVSLLVAPGGWAFSVEDSGDAVPAEIAARLFTAPLPSTSGLGIGLFQAARQAVAAGYRLGLAENRDGAVRFELTPDSGIGDAA